MAKKQNTEIEQVQLTFADAERPAFTKKYNVPYIPFGCDNNYPTYLNELCRRSAKHGAIIKSKRDYIFGKGLICETPTPETDAFIARHSETVKKLILDIEKNGGCYLDIVPNRIGTNYFVNHVRFMNMRTDEENELFWYSKDWNKKIYNKQISDPICAFEKGIRERSVFLYKEDDDTNDPYPLPMWYAALNYIEADALVSQHTFTNAKTGFSGTKFINFYNGTPDNEGKRKVTKQFRSEHGGPSGESVIIAFNAPTDKPPTIDDLGQSALSKEDFSSVNDLITENLYAGHSITVPELFGVPSTASLGGGEGSKLRTGYEIFKNTYVNGKQLAVEKIINFMASLEGVNAKFKLQDSDPVGYEFTETTILSVAPKSWVLEKMGIDISKYQDAPVNGTAVVKDGMEADGANSTLTNLTGRQRQNVIGIASKFANGKLTKAQATILLKSGYGFTDQDVNDWLGIDDDPATHDEIKTAFSSDNDDHVADVFACFGEPRNGYECNFSMELNEEDTFFTFDAEVDISDYIKKHPEATPEVVAKKLNIPLPKVKELFPNLPKVGTIKLPKYEVRYSYEKRPGVGGDTLIATSRPFCVKMIQLDRYYSRTDIQKISAVLGFDVFKRGGGYWGDKYHCRHQFRSNIVTRR
jgi:hypothetical protein